MNKSTNNFRRCSFCPHHEPKKPCCCQSRQSLHSLKTKANSRVKSKSKKTVNLNKSSMSYINNTLPIINNSSYSHMNSNIMAQNSILRTENDYLKRELHSQYQVSAFMKDDRNQSSTLNTSENETSRTYQLHDKLYYANRNLQEALLELDNLSKLNNSLNEHNTKIAQEKEQLRIKNEQLYQQNLRLKKKLKKLHQEVDQYPNQAQLQKIIQVNMKLQTEKAVLQEEIQQLKEQLRRHNNSRTIVEVENLSPEWVAHTSTKINNIQRNITKLQEENKENILSHNNSFISKQITKHYEEEMGVIKKQIISAIKILKLQTQSFKFETSILDEMLYNSNSSLLNLVKSLCQTLIEPLQRSFMEFIKNIDRKLKIYENNFAKVTQRWKNMMIKVENQKLRSKSRANFC